MADKDIVRNYDWTSVPRGSGLREEAPKIIATAHKLESNQLQRFISGYLNTIEEPNSAEGSDPGIAFYKGLYKGGKKLGTYHFPFFTDDYRSFTNQYADSFSPISQRGATMVGAEAIENVGGAGEKLIGGGIALGKGLLSVAGGLVEGTVGKDKEKVDTTKGGILAGLQGMGKQIQSGMDGTKAVGAPGTYIETPKFYQYANSDVGLQVSFALSNTLADDGPKMNADFIKEFTEINRPMRQGSLGMDFPAIYHVEVPGLRYIEWASLDNLSFSMLGQRRNIGGVIQPEAYVVNMSFTSLTIEPANFMKMVQTPPRAGQTVSESTADYDRERAMALGELRSQKDEMAQKRLAAAKAFEKSDEFIGPQRPV
tara:strand:+ start:1811 stop:2917 length:1107 start_codon:yes stop_codon:yes gene_type:complete